MVILNYKFFGVKPGHLNQNQINSEFWQHFQAKNYSKNFSNCSNASTQSNSKRIKIELLSLNFIGEYIIVALINKKIIEHSK